MVPPCVCIKFKHKAKISKGSLEIILEKRKIKITHPAIACWLGAGPHLIYGRMDDIWTRLKVFAICAYLSMLEQTNAEIGNVKSWILRKEKPHHLRWGCLKLL